MEFTEVLKIDKSDFKNRKFKIEICLSEIFKNKDFKDDFIIYKISEVGKVNNLFDILRELKNKIYNFIYNYIKVYKNE